jgi:hypothetical protein
MWSVPVQALMGKRKTMAHKATKRFLMDEVAVRTWKVLFIE